jgi:hypothetical protein
MRVLHFLLGLYNSRKVRRRIAFMGKFVSLMETMLASPIFWGVVAFVAIAFTLSGRLSVSAASIFLWIAWAAAVFGIYRADNQTRPCS